VRTYRDDKSLRFRFVRSRPRALARCHRVGLISVVRGARDNLDERAEKVRIGSHSSRLRTESALAVLFEADDT